MSVTSKTGLLASPKKRLIFPKKKTEIHLKAIANPAPFVLKPFAGIYNPYPYGCSLLCNHPTDNDAKDLLKRAKDTWVTEGRSLLLAEEVAAIKASLEQLQTNDHNLSPRKLHIPIPVESVPEELFRRYTETDSRPLTPAPTLASAHTRASGSRRCVTPDPIPTEIKEKTLLILDLRRSHSQETLSWQGSSQITTEPPLIKIQHADISPPNGSHSAPYNLESQKKNPRSLQSPVTLPKRPKSDNAVVKTSHLEVTPPVEEVQLNGIEEEEDEDRRRGKKRKKRTRDTSRGPPAFQSSIDPETQVATTGFDSNNASARPSLIPNSACQEEPQKEEIKEKDPLDVDSYLNRDILKQLRRELNFEIVDGEFNLKKRLALVEALKTVTNTKVPCSELVQIKEEMGLKPPKTECWLSMPRDFSRSSARFELPMNSDSLSKLTPMDYVKNHVTVSNARKSLYNCVFNKHKIEYEEIEGVEPNTDRKLAGANVALALNTMMGKPLNEKQLNYFKGLVGWSECEEIDFKTFCGIGALCERLLAHEFCPQVPSKKLDPCHEIEKVDFESLPRKLHGQTVDKHLKQILEAIRAL